MRRVVVWFRRDLRVHDHAALFHACNDAEEVIPLFILDRSLLHHPETGSRRVQFLLEALADLDRSLIARGSYLTILQGNPVEVLPRFVECIGAEGVYFSADIERWAGQQRDRNLARIFKRQQRVFRPFLSYYLQTEGEYDRAAWSKAWHAFNAQPPYPAPERIHTPQLAPCAGIHTYGYIPTLRDLGLSPAPSNPLIGGESHARARLRDFLDNRIADYRFKISSPILAEEEGTSRLSAYLKFGCVSVRECVHEARKRYARATPRERKSLLAWVSRLQWRDHFIQKFTLYPEAEFVNLYRPFDTIRRYEDADPKLLAAWQAGRTGFPLVDASMRALMQTGLLNFRMRAMLATFLTINLMIDWRHGAEWFMKHLLDGDACIDHWQWQMQAGITHPARPYVRAYNPLKQCFDHDPEARFIHKYVPELRNLPPPLAFEPHRLTAMEETWYDVRPGRTYPLPIVDAEASRKAGLDQILPIREMLARAAKEGRLGEYRNASPSCEPLLHAEEREGQVAQMEVSESLLAGR